MLKRLTYILFILISINSFATHNRAGEITYKRVSGSTYEITVVLYVKESSEVTRPSLSILWGDNTPLDSILKVSDQSFFPIDIQKRTYVGRHTYPGASPSPYMISVEDPNRNAGILNIPNSINTMFYLQSELYINPFLGVNSSPVLLNPPIDNACVGSIYVHNPGALDSDGDSLYYSLKRSLGEGGLVINNYQFPTASNFIRIDNFTGDLIWDSPTLQGEFNIAILIEEFRGGVKIGSVLRDMQITVVPICEPPPNITGIIDTCIIAGDELNINYSATGSFDVTLTSTGIPYRVVSPAIFQQTALPSIITSAQFNWKTECTHVRANPYSVSIKAIDDGPYNLADFHTTKILVIGPKPVNLTTTVQTNIINLTWDKAKCSQAVSYKIYRRSGPSGWFPGQCETGVPASTGFKLIATTGSINDTTYSDNNNGLGLVSGEDYCYRVVTCYPDGAESIASDEVCDQLKKDVPIITRVNVNTTSLSSGEMYIEWSKPTELDTIQSPGPYRYLIYRGEQSSANMVLIDSTSTINDTTYTDISLNTLEDPYFYRVDIYNLTAGTRDLIGVSAVASSVYLNISPTDNQLTLSWEELVPWTNNQYVVYRKNGLVFDSIGITSNTNYIDTGLINGDIYCYKIKSIGAYSSPGTINPIENFSQEVCAEPLDNIPPCPPDLCVNVNCQKQENIFWWSNQNQGCAENVLQYNIYKKDSLNGEYALLDNLSGIDSTYTHDNELSIVGCYVITAVDSAGNESLFSDSVCVDNPSGACEENKGCVNNVADETGEKNCFIYRLPNVFTPGEDGNNDIFKPFPYRYINSIDIQIFNRWGNLVYQTEDPDILWNGINKISGQMSSDGTYYYVCVVNKSCLNGTQSTILKGFITLIRNKEGTQ